MNAVMQAWKEGGWGMYPLVPVMVLTVNVIVERAAWFRRSAFDAEELMALVEERVRAHDPAAAVTQCTQIHAPVVRVVLAGLLQLGRGDAEVRSAVAGAVLREAPRADRRVGWLATFAQVGALLGFFGTLTGLVGPPPHWYGGEGGPTIDPARRAEWLAGSVSEALHCTQFGLLVALVAGVGYAALTAAARSRQRELDAAAAWVVALADTHRAQWEAPAPYR